VEGAELEMSKTSAVLTDVKRALGRNETVVPTPLAPFVDVSAREGTVDLLQRFTEEASTLGCNVVCIESEKAIAETVLGICRAAGVFKIVISCAALLATLRLYDLFDHYGIERSYIDSFGNAAKKDLVEHLASGHVGVTGIDWAIAETGTIVITSDEDQELLISLLPPIHIAVMKRSQITESLTTVLEELGTERMMRQPPSRSATFITGPSRTSDVELTLSIGVHGPKELHLIVVDK
jgi:L-lactate dehydrogenase complex protein LldG